jgi:hypothetical protein
MTISANQVQFRVRASHEMPPDLRRNVSPAFVDECCKTAWANGWRDPEWLMGYALEGSAMPGVTNAAAMFTARLRDIAATPCPLDDTPAPPAAYVDPAPSGPPARDPRTWAQRCRDALRPKHDESTEATA